jgi:hypothetical protein
VNCKNFQDCVGEIVDKRLSEEETKEALQHATVCPQCERELHALQTCKKTLHEKVKRQSVPQDVYYSIVNKTVNAPVPSLLSKMFGFSLNPAVAFVAIAVVAVAVYSFFFSTPSQIPDDANIIKQSIANYQAVIGGSFKPELISNHENVRSYLEKRAGFSVNVPKMTGCKSCGGILSLFKGIKLAHVVYHIGGETVYIYQANLDEAMSGEKIGVPREVKNELMKTGWYVKDLPEHKTVVLWEYKNTLCAAVSCMDKEKFIAMLSDKE